MMAQRMGTPNIHPLRLERSFLGPARKIEGEQRGLPPRRQPTPRDVLGLVLRLFQWRKAKNPRSSSNRRRQHGETPMRDQYQEPPRHHYFWQAPMILSSWRQQMEKARQETKSCRHSPNFGVFPSSSG